MSSQTPTGAAAERFRRDLDLVRKSLQDDPEAQSRLVERLVCIPRMLAAKNARLGGLLSDAELEDLAQETTLLVWRKRDSYDGRAQVETWVFPFCYHALMNRVRKLSHRPRTVPMEAAASVASEQDRDYSDIHSALEELGPPDNEIVRLKHFDQQSFTAIGETLGISPNTAKSRYYRGVSRLRTLLAEHGEDGES